MIQLQPTEAPQPNCGAVRAHTKGYRPRVRCEIPQPHPRLWRDLHAGRNQVGWWYFWDTEEK